MRWTAQICRRSSTIASMLTSVAFFSALFSVALSTSITDIQSAYFSSPLVGQKITGLNGIVTAKYASGFWISGEPVNDTGISNGISVYTTSNTTLAKVNVGDNITLTGYVDEYRSSSDPNDLYTTEIGSPTSITVSVFVLVPFHSSLVLRCYLPTIPSSPSS